MEEMYWVTRLDQVYAFLTWLWIAAGAGMVIFFVWFLYLKIDGDGYDKEILLLQKLKNYFKKCFIAWILIAFISIFIPKTDDALAIIGVGGTIDYIKENQTAKQLPDKCIKALDLYLEQFNEGGSSGNK